jgi:TonB family protein
MEPFLLYLVKSNLWLSCFALVYFVFLRNERYFLLNRIYLFTAALAVLLLPLIDLSYQDFHFLPTMESAITIDQPIINGVVATEASAQLNWQPLLLILLIVGSLVILTKFVLQITHIVSLIQQSKVERQSALFVVRSPQITTPFSFFSYVFVNPSNSPTEIREILKHEAEHIRQQHWVDLLLSELLVLVMWYNPLVWLFGHYIRQNHEYLADEMVLRNTSNPGEYKAVLINQILGGEVIRLGHMFSYSLNKKRFAMMTFQTSHTIQKLKFLWVIPGVIIIALACSELDEKYAETDAVESAELTTFEIKEGMLYVIDGEIHEVHEKIIHEVLQPEAIQSINVYKGDKALEKYGNIGKNGVIEIVTKSQDFTERLSAFTQKNRGEMPSEKQTDSQGGEIFMVVEEMPEFPGGQEGLMNYLATNINYPVEAAEASIQGRVYVQFIINTEGGTEQIKILRGVHPLLDNEAYRVIETMPAWKPGKQRGRNVSVSYTVPVNFKLQ